MIFDRDCDLINGKSDHEQQADCDHCYRFDICKKWFDEQKLQVKEFTDWLWDNDRKTFALITLGHRELLETKWEEYERVKASKESEEEDEI